MIKRCLVLILSLMFCINYCGAGENMSFGNSLVDAANNGDLEEVLSLIKKSGYKVDDRGMFGATALMRASYSNHLNVAKALLAQGADVNAYDFGGATALHFIARSGNVQILELLLVNKDINVNQPDHDGWTPLLRATNARFVRIVKLLLEKGADPLKTNKWNNNCLTDAVALEDTEILKILLTNDKVLKMKKAEKDRVINFAKTKNNKNILQILEQGLLKFKRSNDIILATTNDLKPEDTKLDLEEIPISNQNEKTPKTKQIKGKKNAISKEDVIELPKDASVIIDPKHDVKKNRKKFDIVVHDANMSVAEKTDNYPSKDAKKEGKISASGSKIIEEDKILSNDELPWLKNAQLTVTDEKKTKKQVKQNEKTKNKQLIVWLEAQIDDAQSLNNMIMEDSFFNGIKIKSIKPYVGKNKSNILRVGPFNANDDLVVACKKITSGNFGCKIIREKK